MFNLADMLIILCSLFLLFIPSITLGQAGISIGWCIWVEYPYVEKCTLPISSPEILCNDVRASSFPVDSPMGQPLLSYRLKTWFCTHGMTYFTHQAGSDVPYLIMADGWKSSSWTAEGMFYMELTATDTVR